MAMLHAVGGQEQLDELAIRGVVIPIEYHRVKPCRRRLPAPGGDDIVDDLSCSRADFDRNLDVTRRSECTREGRHASDEPAGSCAARTDAGEELATPEFDVDFVSNIAWEDDVRESQARGGGYVL